MIGAWTAGRQMWVIRCGRKREIKHGSNYNGWQVGLRVGLRVEERDHAGAWTVGGEKCHTCD